MIKEKVKTWNVENVGHLVNQGLFSVEAASDETGNNIKVKNCIDKRVNVVVSKRSYESTFW